MSSHTIPRSSWRGFFDNMGHAMVGKRAEVETAALDLGDQVVAEWLPLIGITYDDRDNLIDVALTGLDHLIREPTEIYVEDGPDGIETIAVQTGDGARHTLRLREPLMLPEATA